MGASKTDLFNKQENKFSEKFKGLAHPARLAIIETILSEKSCICNDIVFNVKLAQPTISQHLKVLKNAQIIKGKIEGKNICYCIDEKGIDDIISYLNNIKSKITKNTNC